MNNMQLLVSVNRVMHFTLTVIRIDRSWGHEVEEHAAIFNAISQL